MQATETEKSVRAAFGAKMRALRDRLGLSRDAFGRHLGVSATTVKQVELGFQNLGWRARRDMERLEAGGLGMIAESGPRYGATAGTGNDRENLVDLVSRLVADQELKGRAAEIAKVLETTDETGVKIIVRRELEKGGWL